MVRQEHTHTSQESHSSPGLLGCHPAFWGLPTGVEGGAGNTGSCSEDPRVYSYSSSGPTKLQAEQILLSTPHTCSQLSTLLSRGLSQTSGFQQRCMAESMVWDQAPWRTRQGTFNPHSRHGHVGRGVPRSYWPRTASALRTPPPRVPFLDKGEGPF